MKTGVIDIGSNSVRLMMSEGLKTLYKQISVTRLGENISLTGKLTATAIERSADAVLFFYNKAISEGAKNVYAFATAAVRSASNGQDFVNRVKELTGLTVEVLSGETEGKIGLLGATNGADGGVIDVGGASAEIILSSSGKTIYSYSLDLGAVRLYDLCKDDKEKLKNVVKEKLPLYGIVPKGKFYGIGGTFTSLAAIDLELEPYNPEKVHGYKLTKNSIEKLTEKLLNTSIEDRKKLKGLHPKRAEVIAGGAYLVKGIMEYLDLDEITISESDNLEGYLLLKNKEEL